MRNWLAFVFLATVGCSSPPSVEPAASAPETKPPVDSPSPTPVVQAPQTKPGDNPRRIYQLRDLSVGTVTINGRKFKAWLADDEAKQQEGMMWLKESDVKDDEGMLFPMASEEVQRFWMRNCPMALDIIYISGAKKILNVRKAQPFDESSVPSEGPAKYVFELKGGMAAKFGIKAGMSVEIKLP